MDNITLSIVIPCYNEKNNIHTIVEKVLAAPVKNKEIIVVDDKSTDGTSEILKSFADSDNRVKVHTNETNLRLPSSLNKAISLAKGKYIADYDRRITYPVGVHIYYDGQIHEVIRSISGYRKPATVTYWEESTDINLDASQIPLYSQFSTYYPGDKVNYNGVVYLCLSENGHKFDDIRIPMVGGWIEAETTL